MKPIEGYNKLRGGYYTPDKISEFIAEWAIRKTSDSVLEPSCGDGSFLSAITTRYRELGATDEQIQNNVLGIELDDIEAEKSSQYGTTVVKEQNEFRISLPKLRIEQPEIYQVGSLLDIAYCLPLRHLKHGVIIANNDADFEYLKTRCQESGFSVGDSSRFTD